MSRSQKVLIVAKCNVNRAFAILVKFNPFVLIVAKCNVNTVDKLIDENAIAY